MSGDANQAELDAVSIVAGALGPLTVLVQQAIADGAKTDAEALHIAMQRLITDGHVERTLPAVQASIAEAMKRVAPK